VFTLQPEGGGSPKQVSVLQDEGQEAPEFVVTVVHTQSGRVFSPFIVRARDEAAARKLCQRNYLVLQSVERYSEREGVAKPRTLPYGPPISDRDFEADYGNRPADTSTPDPTPSVLAALGGFLFGPIGALLGWWAGNPSRGQHRGD
jgi:hypothetical protein